MRESGTNLSQRPVSPNAVTIDEAERLSLCEALDRVLNKGAVVTGEVIISVADIDLIYLGLKVLLTSVETARTMRRNDTPKEPVISSGAGWGSTAKMDVKP